MRSSIFSIFSSFSNIIFRPVFILGNNLGESFSNFNSAFFYRESILKENEDLKLKISENLVNQANYNAVLDENLKLKEILGRKTEKENLVLAAILAKPNQSLYDTLIIDAGKNQGLFLMDKVFALGNIPIGYVATLYPNSSKVILFSNAGEKTDGVISGKDIFVQLIGRGGGNFEVVMPLNLNFENGAEIVLPGIKPYLLATFEKIISDPRDSYKKALFVSPVNIQELKFVEVKK